MQTITINGQVSIISNNLRTVISLQDSLTTTGSNFLANNATIPTGSWTALDQGSNTNFRIGYFANLDTVDSIQLAIGSTGSYACWLQPEDVAILPNSGSCIIYAKAFGANSPVVLQYLISEQ